MKASRLYKKSIFITSKLLSIRRAVEVMFFKKHTNITLVPTVKQIVFKEVTLYLVYELYIGVAPSCMKISCMNVTSVGPSCMAISSMNGNSQASGEQ